MKMTVESELRMQGEQLVLHRALRHGIQRAERLVHENHLRVHDQCTRKVDALLHTTGQLVRVMLLEPDSPTRLSAICTPSRIRAVGQCASSAP